MTKEKWLDVLTHPCAVAISGARGAGKSCLAYYLAEILAKSIKCDVSILGLPPDRADLLPKGFKVIETAWDAPPNCVLLIDECALQFHSRRSMSKENLGMDQLLSISRQANQTLIFATHNFRKMDIALVMDMDVIAFKQPSMLHSMFERAEIRAFTQSAAELFKKGFKDKSNDNPKAWTYVMSDNFVGMIENSEPTFWSDQLSRGFAQTSKYARHFLKHGVNLKPAQFERFETHPMFEVYRTDIDENGLTSSYLAGVIKDLITGKRTWNGWRKNDGTDPE